MLHFLTKNVCQWRMTDEWFPGHTIGVRYRLQRVSIAAALDMIIGHDFQFPS